MKKLLGIVVLGILISCSKDVSEKTLTNCADNSYSENKATIWTIYNNTIKYGSVANEFEKHILIFKSAGFESYEINEWIVELVLDKNMDGYEGKDLHAKQAKAAVKKIDNDIRRLTRQNLNSKMQNNEYEALFFVCEKTREESPKTFDAKWKKPKIIYLEKSLK
tara:strand:+ start:1612 stop:2103 length:492 start_codon:yes stop_codon:yes gene_type:complete